MIPKHLKRAIKQQVFRLTRTRLSEDAAPMLDDRGLALLNWQKAWKTDLLARLADLVPGAFVDVGANMGQTLIDLWSVFPTKPYIGFEPNISCARFVSNLIRVNNLPDHRIVPIALFDKADLARLYFGERSDPGATIMGDRHPNYRPRYEHVACFPFDQIRHHFVKEISFVKIDAEGSELGVLRGMQSAIHESRPIILCEVLFTDKALDLSPFAARNFALTQLVGDLNYRIRQVSKSDDGSKVAALQTLAEFPTAHYSSSNADLCDYLLIPAELEREVIRCI